MKTSQKGIDLLKSVEGWSPTPYPDAGGHIAIGWGRTIRPGELLPSSVTMEEEEPRLRKLVEWSEKVISLEVHVPLNQNQFDALVSFIYNIGSGAFGKSTLLRKLNQGVYKVDDEFRKWVYADGQVNEGLKNRREKEIALFNLPVDMSKIPEVQEMEEANKPPVVIQKTVCNDSNFLSINLRDMGKGLLIAILGGVIPSIYDIISNGALPTLEQLKAAGVIGLVAGFSYLIKNYFQNSCGQVFKKDPPKEPNTLLKLDIGGLLK